MRGGENTKLAHGGHQIQVHSDKMGFVMTRQEARPHKRWPKTLKGQLENNSRKPRDLVRDRHSDSLNRVQLSLSKGKMNKGDEVADDKDYDAVRTGVSQDRVTAKLCTEEFFLSTQHLTPHAFQKGQP